MPARVVGWILEPRPHGEREIAGCEMTYQPGVWDGSECALVLMDYQPEIIATVFEQDRRLIELNARSLADLAVRFEVPVVLSSVSVRAGVNSPTIRSLKEVLPDVAEIDRNSTNAWEDEAFVAAVKATGRRKLVLCGLVTSVCLAYPSVCAAVQASTTITLRTTCQPAALSAIGPRPSAS
jgi:nicotinamidase-related amidase